MNSTIKYLSVNPTKYVHGLYKENHITMKKKLKGLSSEDYYVNLKPISIFNAIPIRFLQGIL